MPVALFFASARAHLSFTIGGKKASHTTQNLALRRRSGGKVTAAGQGPLKATPADAQRQERCSHPRRDRRGRVVALRPLLLAAAAARREPAKNAEIAAVVVDSSSLLLLAAGLLLWPWLASLPRRRERCCLGAFPTAALSSAPRKCSSLGLLASRYMAAVGSIATIQPDFWCTRMAWLQLYHTPVFEAVYSCTSWARILVAFDGEVWSMSTYSCRHELLYQPNSNGDVACSAYAAAGFHEPLMAQAHGM